LIKDIAIQDYTYELPEELIAKYPLEKRDDSRLLVFKNKFISDNQFTDLVNHLPENALMLFNNTKVIQARLVFNRETGAKIEIMCLEPHPNPEMTTALNAKGTAMWKAFVGNAKKWNQGEKLIRKIPYADGEITLTAILLNKLDDAYVVGFFWDPFSLTLAEVLHYAGSLPIPPYLKRETETSDEERYQTVYAQHKGSVAAPTAGLHFTFESLDAIQQKGIEITDVTLHVGAGTFKPVKSDTIGDHLMHDESVSVSLETLKLIHHHLTNNKPIVAVGTTVTRTIESLYWHGLKLNLGIKSNVMEIHQWEPYELENNNLSASDSFDCIIKHLEANNQTEVKGSTSLMIVPGYQFKIIDMLVTNFHQPQSTLLLLIAAFVGNQWRNIYNHALQNRYRFLSYGDSSLLFKK